jgi:hypothetical protein
MDASRESSESFTPFVLKKKKKKINDPKLLF